ncbi:MAG TPA: cytosine permease [Planktothrix sp.]|jgi:purine-cytosine permease-like protein
MDLKNTGAMAAAAVESQDHTTDIVPLSERRGPVTLGLLWITMVTGFPSVLAGFDWWREGLTITQVLWCTILSSAIMLAYTIPACMLGATSGQTYGLLSRKLFGRIGCLIVSLNVSWISLGWYGLTAYFLADGIKGVYNLPIDTMWLSAIFAFAMAFNNLFGFSGVAAFAGYLAAPVLILWVGISFVKATVACPASVFHAQPHVATAHALTLVSAFVIGYGAWGNEQDYWRYAKPRLSFTVIPLLVAIGIGQIVFPLTGWMLARLTGVTNYAAASALMTRYAFGGATIIAALVLFVTYCALNDANLYAAINGIANLKQFHRKKLALTLTVLGAIVAAGLSRWSRSFEAVASLSSTILPCATVVMIAEWYVLAKFVNRKPDFTVVPDLSALPVVRWSAVIALAVGSAVGLLTAGIIPGLEKLQVGVCSLQAWLASFIVYMILRPLEMMAETPITGEKSEMSRGC